jgi:hypothetical protein
MVGERSTVVKTSVVAIVFLALAEGFLFWRVAIGNARMIMGVNVRNGVKIPYC